MESDDILKEIEKLKKSNILVIVEGKKDKSALGKFNISKVLTLEKNPLYKVVEKVSEKEKKAAILTDLDKEGKKIYSVLNDGLCRNGVHVENHFREFLFKKTKLRQIEGLPRYVKRLEENQ